MPRKVVAKKAQTKPKAKRPTKGRPAHEPTDDTRHTVLVAASCGMHQEEIAAMMRMDRDTLAKHYRYELDHGLKVATVEMADSLFRRGKAGSDAAAIFWLKTRAHWREAPQTIEHTGKDGGPIETKVEYSDAEIAQRIAFMLAKGVREPEADK